MKNSRIWFLVSAILLSVTLLPACQFTPVEPGAGSPAVQAPPEEPASVEPDAGSPAVQAPSEEPASAEPDAGSPAVQAPPEEPAADLYYLIHMDPAEVDNSDLPVTPVEKLHRTGVPPDDLDITQYRLTTDGTVENPLALTYEDILSYPTVTEVVLLICPGFFVDNAEWTGVPVATLLAEAGVKPEATDVTFTDLEGGYSQTLPLEVALQDGVFLAHTVNGQVLPVGHGYPLRLVVEGRYGSNWVKWVGHVEVS
jgi:DMSO/TMAO reductase YedYZ molybdopterin-dependent catalytic subunit